MSRRRQQQKEDPLSSSEEEASFASFSNDEEQEQDDISMQSDSRSDSSYDSSDDDHHPRKEINLTKDSDEEDLERLVLGTKSADDFRTQLFAGNDFLPDITDARALVPVAPAADQDNALKQVDDAMLFMVDTVGGGEGVIAHTERTAEEEPADKPAWEDSDDERLAVSLAGVGRLRKLREFEGEDVVNGVEYSQRLRAQYLRMYPLPEWARPAEKKKRRSKRRSSAAGAGGSDESGLSGSEMDTEDEEGEDYEDALPLDQFLRNANAFAEDEMRSSKRRKLRPETLDIQRTRDIPDVHKSGVSCLAFHPKHPILLSTSVSSVMFLHHIDAAAYPTPNPMLTSVQVRRTDLRRAAFLSVQQGEDDQSQGEEEVVFAGRRRYFHSWNLSTGAVKKVSKIAGHQKEHKTMERFRASPCGRWIAVAASERKGGGILNILNAATMQWVAQARIDGRGGIADFQWWSNGEGLTIAGKDGQVAEWSLEAKRTVGVWRDEGSVGGTVLAMGGRSGPRAIGEDRWVAVGNNSGIVNIYDRNELLVAGKKDKRDVEIKKLPTPARVLEQLTTAITILAFSPDGQLMVFGSNLKKDALRLVHLPSCTVYRNWPTEQTPLGRVSAVAFSADSSIMAIGNDSGKVRLWEIRG
ncbi:putative U3 small nucleolar RNA-associated protein 18 [Triangularia verruculosa]|uniref:U3 small nucleolar RNA-associated protein 18 n=1 Tax=Triangularia verruculosa TaxID=2587418 RepID=A0AAN7AYU9_9PEZI|nr:putative U3 small nucleolar RNA-associated protein 18 [Triangularia verruculosa]